MNLSKTLLSKMSSDPIYIGVIGGGFVGSATALLNTIDNIRLITYDIDPSKCVPSGISFKDLEVCKLIFICVPTPMSKDGSCYTGIVEKVIQDCKSLHSNPYIVVRSTVPVGFCEKHSVYFMPEFLTEKNWKHDFLTASEWIIGEPKEISNESFRKFIETISLPSVTQFVFIPTSEAEAIKYFRNCFLATKVSFCNEFANFCKTKGIDYNTVSTVAARDYRIGSSHIKVPGHDGHKGFGGTCFPKDMASLSHQLDPENNFLIKASIERNVLVDRIEQDWLSSPEFKGRATL